MEGARYQNVKLDDGGEPLEGDFWGFMIPFGWRMGSETPIAPFFELGWSFMDDIVDIWDFTLGARVALGR